MCFCGVFFIKRKVNKEKPHSVEEFILRLRAPILHCRTWKNFGGSFRVIPRDVVRSWGNDPSCHVTHCKVHSHATKWKVHCHATHSRVHHVTHCKVHCHTTHCRVHCCATLYKVHSKMLILWQSAKSFFKSEMVRNWYDLLFQLLPSQTSQYLFYLQCVPVFCSCFSVILLQ